MLEFRILGTLEVINDGTPVPINGRRQRALLTILLLHANQPMSTERLVDLIWGEAPPPQAGAALHNAVVLLRRAFAPQGQQVLQRQPNGYRLTVEPDQLDATRFERLVRQARGAAAAEKLRLLTEASALWRGPALADFELERFAVD